MYHSFLTALTRHRLLVPAALVGLALVPSIAGVARLLEMSNATVTSENARFLAQPLPAVLHLVAVIPCGMVGAFQFAPGLRRRRRDWHRAAGRVLVVLGLVASLTGLWMTLSYEWPVGDGVALFGLRLFFGSAMTIALLLGMDAIRRRDFTAHGSWMTRAYAIGMGAGTQVFTHLPYFLLLGQPDESARAVAMGAGWVINLLVAEVAVRRSTVTRRPVAEGYAFP